MRLRIHPSFEYVREIIGCFRKGGQVRGRGGGREGYLGFEDELGRGYEMNFYKYYKVYLNLKGDLGGYDQLYRSEDIWKQCEMKYLVEDKG